LEWVDRDRIAAMGGSQGGAQTLAVAALSDKLAAAIAYVPFLCDIRRATEITDADPYGELIRYMSMYRDQVEHVFGVYDYFDGMNFARISKLPIAMTVGLIDEIVPASTVYAAYNNYAGADKQLWVWPFNGHEGGGFFDEEKAFAFFGEKLR
jgi:cephalosporin-C deacetylase